MTDVTCGDASTKHIPEATSHRHISAGMMVNVFSDCVDVFCVCVSVLCSSAFSPLFSLASLISAVSLFSLFVCVCRVRLSSNSSLGVRSLCAEKMNPACGEYAIAAMIDECTLMNFCCCVDGDRSTREFPEGYAIRPSRSHTAPAGDMPMWRSSTKRGCFSAAVTLQMLSCAALCRDSSAPL